MPGGVPRVIAALRPRMLELARDRTAGAPLLRRGRAHGAGACGAGPAAAARARARLRPRRRRRSRSRSAATTRRPTSAAPTTRTASVTSATPTRTSPTTAAISSSTPSSHGATWRRSSASSARIWTPARTSLRAGARTHRGGGRPARRPRPGARCVAGVVALAACGSRTTPRATSCGRSSGLPLTSPRMSTSSRCSSTTKRTITAARP